MKSAIDSVTNEARDIMVLSRSKGPSGEYSAMRTKPQTVTGWEGFPGAKCTRLTEAAPPALCCVSRARSELVDYSQY